MSDYQVDYKISRNAKITLAVLFLIFLGGFSLRIVTLFIRHSMFDFVLLSLFAMFFVFSSAALWKFLIKKQPVVAISSKHLLVSVPYFFKIKKISLSNIKEIKVSVWSRSEIIFQDGIDVRTHPFMSLFLSSEDRESFISNIFDLLPNTTVR